MAFKFYVLRWQKKIEKVELDFQFQFKFFEVREDLDVILLRCSKSGQNG